MTDIEEAISYIESTEKHLRHLGESWYADYLSDAIDLLKDQEAVVRCKYCINCVKEPNGELYCDILAVGYEPLGSKKVNADWYCADGVKRDE